MKRKGENIITDQDITLTAYGNQEKTLSEALTDQQNEIDQLKSNVKFIYKYGGIGSGAGSGSQGGGQGGGSTSSWRAVVTRLDTGATVKSDQTINLGKVGVFGFSVQIYGGGTSSFNITYAWTNTFGNQTRTDLVTAAEGFKSTQSLQMDENGILSILIVNQDTQEPVTWNIPYITTSYKFNLFYVNKDDTHTEYTPSNNNIYMSEVKTKGLQAALYYSVAVGITSVEYTYIDWEGNSHTVKSSEESDPTKIPTGKASNIIYLELCDDIVDFLNHNENAKYKQFSVNIKLLLEGSVQEETIQPLYLRDNLIPSDMYLKIMTTAGSLYEEIPSEWHEADKFNLGANVFNLTPYNGAFVASRKYDLSVELDGQPVDLTITQLSDQTTQAVSIPISSSDQHTIKFTIQSGSVSYSAFYYLCAKTATSSFDWYPASANPKYKNYYRRYEDSNITGLSSESTIAMTINSRKTTYNFKTDAPQTYNDHDQLLSIGFQYSEINDLEMPICSFDTGTTGSIFVYQNKVIISSTASIPDPTRVNGDSREIFLPMASSLDDSVQSNYHNLIIYKRYEGHYGDSNSYFKGIYIYLDGILEGVFESKTAEHFRYKSISFYPGNYFINTIENTCFPHGDNAATRVWMSDNDMMAYYYTYKEAYRGMNVTDQEKKLYSSFSEFKEGEDNFITVPESAIGNIAKYSSVPTLVISFTDTYNGSLGPRFSAYGQDNFKAWMSEAHEENDEIESPNINIQWCAGGGEQGAAELRDICKHGTTPADFSITMQGSSTLGYRCKNWELMAPVSDTEGYTCLYSPNFSPDDPNTFLPEESFTLKADVVDSSHTNNNAIGAFVNATGTKFRDAEQSASPYSAWIKNCLTGFPVLVFLHTKYKVQQASQDWEDRFYFLGIYNFNLGRKSYFNLGYKDTSSLPTLETGFKMIEISASANRLLTPIRVGEVQGNNAHFDFSQADTSVLFKIGDGDKTYMFGDFVNGQSASDEEAKTAIQSFVQKVALGGGWAFEKAGKTLPNTAANHYGYDEKYSGVDANGIPKNQVPNYRWNASRTASGSSWAYTYTDSQRSAAETDLVNLIVMDEATGRIPALDYTSLCEYYTTCMAFGLVDSVQKNLNIKSWNSGNTFYLAFYDMDTCLGVSNSGSRISYYAFSDFWTSSIDEQTNRLSPVSVYRDYSPVVTAEAEEEGSSSYFDVPSSYLFAVAKYAYYVLNKNEDLKLHPSNLWGKWRNSTRSATDPQLGCLSDSDYFIDTFYEHHLDAVPECAFNHNYRYKYLVNSELGRTFDTTNFSKFYGRKLAYTRDWLQGRFHILDAYFNINGLGEQVGSIRVEGTENDFRDTTNPDIFVLHDIFSSSSNGNQYANLNYDINVTARPYAPLIANTPTSVERYIFPAVSKECVLNLSTSGNQYLLLGGSSLWTNLNTINPFITQNGSLMVNSRYFDNLSGTAGSCRTWSIATPSLKTISLTRNTSYSGNLSFTSETTSESFPNLQSIDISGTKLKLTASNLKSLKTVSALDMVAGAELDLSNVGALESLSVSGNLNRLNCPTPTNIMYFPTTYQSNRSDHLNCNEMNITNGSTKSGSVLYIYNNDTLTSLTFSGFERVVVENCPKLQIVTIGDTNILKNLSIIMPSSTTVTDLPVTFQIGPNEGVADLSNQGVLETVTLKKCLMTTLKLPGKDVALPAEAFKDCAELTYLHGSGTYNIMGASVFRDCPKFTLRQSAGGSFANLKVPTTTTTLAYTFYISNTNLRGAIDLAAAKNFLENSCATADHVTSLAYTFYNQNITYNLGSFKNEYALGMCSLNFAKFPRCTDYSYTFYNNPVNAYNRYMFKGASTAVNSITVNCVVSENTTKNPYSSGNDYYKTYSGTRYHVVYATTDFLAEVIGKISSLSLRVYDQDASYFVFLKMEGEILVQYGEGPEAESLNLYDIFNPGGSDYAGGYAPTVLTSFSNFEIYPGHKLNFYNWFNTGWSQACSYGISIGTVMYYGNYSNVETTFEYQGTEINTLDGLLWTIKPKSITLFLNQISGYEERVDMSTFINWDQNLNYATNLFLSTSGYKSLGFNKKVKYTNDTDIHGAIIKFGFQGIWHRLITKAPNLSQIGSLFENCVIYSAPSDSNMVTEFDLYDHTEYPNISSASIKYLGWVFNNCYTVSGDDNFDRSLRTYWDINHEFFHALPNLTWVCALFANTCWEHTIPFDFFLKRADSYRTGIYVDYTYIDPETQQSVTERRPARIHTYSYKQEMSNLSSCFSNVELRPSRGNDLYPYAFDPMASYNNDASGESTIKRAYICRYEGGEEVDPSHHYDYYYTSTTTSTITRLEQPTEIQDLDDLHGDGVPTDYLNYTTDVYTTGRTIQNQPISGYKGYFVSPDVLYGCTQSVGSISSCFYGNGENVFTGAIPPHLLKNAKTWPIGNLMRQLNIVPFKFGEISDSGVTTRYYRFVPKDFTTQQNLGSAFNFKMILPETSSNRNIKTHYYILLDDSISKDTSSFSSAFPDSSYDRMFGQPAGWPQFWNNDFGLEYYIIGHVNTTKDEYDVEHITGIESGFDMAMFTKLKLDNAISPHLAAVWCGSIFRNDRQWDINWLNDINNYFIEAGYSGSDISGISYKLSGNWPTNNNQFLRRVSGDCNVRISNIKNWSAQTLSEWQSKYDIAFK